MNRNDDDALRTTKINRRNLIKTSAAVGAGALAGSKFAATKAAPGATGGLRRYSRQGGGEITFAAQKDDIDKVQPLLDEYSQKNNVKITTAPNIYADLYAKMNINLTQATGAYDVVSMDDPWMPLFAGGEFLANLGEMLDKKGVKADEDFLPQLLALGEYPQDSGLRGIPWVGNVQTFAWRTDVLDEMGKEVPKTWDEVLTLATAVTDAKGSAGLYGIGLRGKAGNPAATSFLPVLRGFGKDLLDPTTSEPQLETPEAMAAIDLHLKLKDQAPPGVENVGHPENGIHLYSGKIAMSGDIWPDQLLQAFDPKLSKVIGKIEVGPEPAQSGVKPADMTGNWLLGIPEGAKNSDAALDFILWFTAAEQQKRLLMDQNIPATRLSVLQDPEAVDKFPFLPGLLNAAKQALPRPRTPFYSALEEIYGRWVAEAIAGQTSGEDAMKNANKEMRDLLVREDVLK
ncbi:MAG: extracellular solute-binding protein [Thermomicrobiales bacterium]